MSCSKMEAVKRNYKSRGSSNREPLDIFLSIPREDILHREIFRKLSYEDLINLQKADDSFYDAVNSFIGRKRILNSSNQKPDVIKAMLPQTMSLRALSFPKADWLRNEELIDVLERNPQLEALYITRSQKITEEGLNPVLKVENLRRIVMRRTPAVTDSFLRELGKFQPNLEEVDLRDNVLSDCGLAPLFQRCHGIRVIKFSISEGVTNKSIHALVENCLILQTYEINITEGATPDAISDVLGTLERLYQRK